tara:strand:- start:45 stop:611 length:567 start_codon:yes stop_codon:yes gene_type:complete
MTKAREWTEEEKQWMTDNLSYVPETGDLVWKEVASSVNNLTRTTGSVAGALNKLGYLRIFSHVEGKKYTYRAHRIVWFLNYGEVPSIIDHINGNKLDNRIENLRATTHYLNLRNQKKTVGSSSIYKGVHYHKARNNYVASLRRNYKKQHIGTSKLEVEAAQMYDKWIEDNLTPLERQYSKTNKELGLL